ncbi:MAG: DUF305 domain-containing protein [Gemmatimonadetes bacterium]|nr:MAG: hypothetical protein AUI09_00245 [Gemmatimonadetes bacterium 13_2_20CM_2_66_5]OLC86721.1 MAG: hypothetical protein AUI86_08640 [Gemmatimonadetes bacterium 13_1_40CM_3_66_12]OLD85227.1 MAG: hypothetical protein AUG85_14325 [Gemmatimonadetes bacterium 13_1_20CM_4_66_11]PYP95045.1 MAG: DUF305 domain-containing protein [Gemmatimonadota bacterium]
MTRFIPWLVAAAIARVSPAAAQAPRDYTAADVRFMSGMIYHHAQAVLIAGWAPSHDAGPSLRTLCDRIVASQKDEIALLSRWLADRHEAVPHTDPEHMMMPEMDSTHMMPGMLSAEQLAQLDRAQGAAFDRLFLSLMIQHHQGAITMVNQLFAAGAGEEEPVYKMASSVFADQTTEIERMQRMLAADLFAPPSPK